MIDSFSEFTTDEKRAYLKALQSARLDLALGKKVAKAGYTQGGTNRNAEFMATDMASLQALIGELQVSLGMGCRRRALGFRF